MIKIPTFATKQELYSYLKKNKALHIQAKKSAMKYADCVSGQIFTISEKGTVEKTIIDPAVMDVDNFKILVAINTCNYFDSHGDVHIPGLWKKSVSEQKLLYLLQEHKMTFENVISDDVKASAKNISWADLGETYPGTTEALLFDCNVSKERNEFMSEQYKKCYVKNHSVGMRYINIELAMNSESKFDVEEKAIWDKYYPQIVNKEAVDQYGYFWAVIEAKFVEGSAVLMGSNQVTPTISISAKQEPVATTPKTEPSEDTQKNGLSFILG